MKTVTITLSLLTTVMFVYRGKTDISNSALKVNTRKVSSENNNYSAPHKLKWFDSDLNSGCARKLTGNKGC